MDDYGGFRYLLMFVDIWEDSYFDSDCFNYTDIKS